MSRFTVIIPARYASSRLPGKPLLEIAGEPMIRHVHRRAEESGATRIVIATDDQRVAEVARGFGAEVCMTRPDHGSGTDRLAEAVTLLGLAEEEIVVNVQGDEPLLPGTLIRQVAGLLERHPGAAIATLCEPLRQADGIFDPHIVKVVRDQEGYALYFSRAPIPWWREGFDRGGCSGSPPADSTWQRHIGLYAYRVASLARFTAWPTAPLEELECLEQLRALWHGERIVVAEATEPAGHGVDTPADLERVREALGNRPSAIRSKDT
ncbi:MAG: 3-deoxy-manno-octulosonate cytidylyltransferase [Gammaproteobacteria bacterium]|nr:MAG: 3-deoxy-manno-octulosonate cytidylyltransferase [Gammaproteobacteria bacterium]